MKYIDFVHEQSKKGCSMCRGDDYIIQHNDYAYVTPALAPYTPWHLLVILKSHKEKLSDLSVQELQAMSDLWTAWIQILEAEYGEVVGFVRQWEVFGTTGKSQAHLHRHIVPHFSNLYGGSQESSDARKILTREEIVALGEVSQGLLAW